MNFSVLAQQIINEMTCDTVNIGAQNDPNLWSQDSYASGDARDVFGQTKGKKIKPLIPTARRIKLRKRRKQKR